MQRFDSIKDNIKLNFYELILFPKLSKMIGKLRENELITIAARCGMGKTSLATNLLVDLASKNKCLYVSYEMNTKELIDKINKFCLSCNKRNIFFEDRAISLPDLENEIAQTKAKFIFIDYIQLMPGKLKNNTTILKEICRKYNVVIFMLSQLNRRAQEKEPNLAMISNSSTIEADSDQVWFIKQNEIIIAKNRKGKTGSIPIYFNKKYSFFNEVKRTIVNKPKNVEYKPVGYFDTYSSETPTFVVSESDIPQQRDILLDNIWWLGEK